MHSFASFGTGNCIEWHVGKGVKKWPNGQGENPVEARGQGRDHRKQYRRKSKKKRADRPMIARAERGQGSCPLIAGDVRFAAQEPCTALAVRRAQSGLQMRKRRQDTSLAVKDTAPVPIAKTQGICEGGRGNLRSVTVAVPAFQRTDRLW